MLESLSLFSGIGGFELAAKQVGGFEVKQLVEIDPDARQVLSHHFPNTPIHDDIRTYQPSEKFDICWGGFPCTGTSSAGDKTGLEHHESSLWWEMYRIIAASKPRFVLIENPEGLRHRGLARVIHSLAEVGYVGEWQCISAADIGAPHQRERLFIIAYPNFWQQEKGMPPCWSSQIGSEIETARSNSRFPTIEQSNDGIAYGFPAGLDGVPCSVPQGTPGRIRSRYLYGRSVVPACAAVAFHRIKFLSEWYGDV